MEELFNITQSLKATLPDELQPYLPQLSKFLKALLDVEHGGIAPGDLPLPPKEVFAALAARPLQIGDKLMDFSNAQTGDITIQKVVGGNSVELHFVFQQPTAYTAVPDASEWPSIAGNWENWLQAQRAALSAELDDHEGPSPLDGIWKHFLTVQPWHEELAELCTRAEHQAEQVSGFDSLAAGFAGIDWTTSYESIAEQLAGLGLQNAIDRVANAEHSLRAKSRRLLNEERYKLDQLANLRRALVAVRYQLRRPYSRCLLVLGRLGAGKTHFVRRALSPLDDVSTPLLLPLARARRGANVEETVLSHIAEASGRGWKTLETFSIFVDAACPGGRLFVIVDDAHLWAVGDGGAGLTQLVRQTSRLHNISWLITADFNFYERLRHDVTLWRQYSIVGASGEGVGVEETGLEIELPVVDGWIDLYQLDLDQRVGDQLLRTYWGQDSTTLLDLSAALQPRSASARYLALPFTAWMVIGKQLRADAVVSLNFIEFVELFWSSRFMRAQVVQPEAGGPVGREQAETILSLVRLKLAELGSAGRDYMVDYDTALAAVASVLVPPSPDLARWALSLLVALDLAEETRITAPGSLKTTLFQRVLRRYRLRYELFWDAHIAAHLIEQPLNVLRQAKPIQELDAVLDAIAKEYGQSGVYEYLLLLADAEGMELATGRQFVASLCERLLRADGISAAVIWLAGIHGSDEFQRLLLEYAQDRALADAFPDEAFAFVYFVAEALDGLSGPSAVGLRKRVSLLQRQYRVLARMAYGSYFTYLVRLMVKRAGNAGEIARALPHFEGCEEFDLVQIALADGRAQQPPGGIAQRRDVALFEVTRDVAEIVVAGLWRETLLGASVEDEMSGAEIRNEGGAKAFLNHCLAYLQRFGSPTQDKYVKADKRRELFYEWVLYYACEHIVAEYGVESYYLFASRGWYHNLRGTVGENLGLLLREEANLAMGNWYFRLANNYGRDLYLKLVKRLAASKDPREREVAFYLIRHSRPTYGRAEVQVDQLFLPTLEKLYMDPDLALSRRNLRMIRHNISPERLKILDKQRGGA